MSAENTVRPTEVVADARPLLDTETGTLAVPVLAGNDANDSGAVRLGSGGSEIAEALGLDLLALLERESARTKAGEIVSMPVFAEGRGAASVDGEVDVTRVILVGLGDESRGDFRAAGAAVGRAAKGVERMATSVTAEADDECARSFVEGLVLATYAMGDFRGSPLPEEKRPPRTVVLAGEDDRTEIVASAAMVANAVWAARDLVHTPSNVKDPSWLAQQARDIGSTRGLDVRVRDEKALADEGFGGLVAVGMGSDRPPRLVAMRYEPKGAGGQTPHVVLVGKGITYDTGGLSLKPREAMVPMKTDMSGAAVVMGALSAVRDLGIDVRVTGLIAAAENMPGASAQRPSDVIRQYDGTTVEVLNTDAEGRLVLADAIAYAVAELEPTVVVDVATLTGAATVGLGREQAALFSNDDDLAAALSEAGASAGERLWQLPLVDDYRDALESPVADIAHVETTKVGGGAITAALFLQRFAGDVGWAHLDIAGVGRSDGNQNELVKGGTAFGVRALLYWLESGAPTTPDAVT